MQNLNWNWTKSSSYPTKGNGLNVFGTFICGGGSTMGYKLAGYNHLGGVEIDRRMAGLYKVNHNPKYLYVEDIRKFNEREDLPDELYKLNILDGSPPCSTFSLAGNREKDWGKEKVFREGQTSQTLDDLVFVYTDTILKLKPKVAILENVKGIVSGLAKGYAIGIYDKLTDAGYNVQIFNINAVTTGVPQARDRIFFIARKSELDYPDLDMGFTATPIAFGEVAERNPDKVPVLLKSLSDRVPYIVEGESDFRQSDKRFRKLETASAFYNSTITYNNAVHKTLTSSGHSFYWDEKRLLVDAEYIRISSFPADYDFGNEKVRYVCGMSVPPLMTARIAKEIERQWFNKFI